MELRPVVVPLQTSQSTKKSHVNLKDWLRPLSALDFGPEVDASNVEDPAEGFTEEFKKTIRAIREETGVSGSLLDEEAAIEEIIKSNEAPYLAKSKNTNRGSPIMIEIEEEEDNVSESYTWKMLAANDSKQDFKVSPPFYNAFREEEKHWLERPPISLERVEESKKKCEKWLNDNLK